MSPLENQEKDISQFFHQLENQTDLNPNTGTKESKIIYTVESKNIDDGEISNETVWPIVLIMLSLLGSLLE